MITLPIDITIEKRGLTFNIRPEMAGDMMSAIGEARREGFDSLENTSAINFVLSIAFIKRITSWSGVGSSPNKEADCTDRNKRLLFAQETGLLKEIMDEVERIEEDDKKKLKTTQDG